MPIAAIPYIETWRNTVSKLEWLKKRSVTIEKNKNSATNTSHMALSFI
jgi:hypothetical protein